ncbi:hypothetical protein JCM11251_003059 [Rhodosporidiobolus azoricus]
MARPRAARLAHPPSPPPPDDPSSRSPRKRNRSQNATPQPAPSAPNTAADSENDAPRSIKRAKRGEHALKDEMDRGRTVETATSSTGRGGADSSSPPSATLVASQDGPTQVDQRTKEEARETEEKQEEQVKKEEKPSVLDGMSAEERRKAKGKGRATKENEERKAAGKRKEGENEDGSELATLRRDIAAKDELLARQLSALESLHSAVACTVCLETLDRPYALACGHVFCRKCLLNWFFRPDPNAEAAEEAAANADAQLHSGSSRSGSSSSSDDDDDFEDDSSHSGSGSGRSYVGGVLAGREFRVNNLPAESSGDAFETAAGGMWDLFEGASTGRRGRGELDGGSGGNAGGGSRQRDLLESAGRATGGSGTAESRITEVDETVGDGEKKKEEARGDDEPERPLSPGAMRRARLARFSTREGAVTDEADAKMDVDASSATPAATGGTTSHHFSTTATSATGDQSATRPSPPSRVPSPAPPPPAPASPAAAPPPPPPPPLPQCAHRLKNLVCPSCRTPCSERSPSRIFVLDEVLSSLRRSGVREDGSLRSSSSTRPLTPAAAASASNVPGLSENDANWGGLFPGVGGTESKGDRRRRLAQMVRDREDGVRRCGHCNWEIDERTGLCEGCGHNWDVSSRSASDSGDSEDETGPGFSLGWGRANPGRRHDDVLDSGESSGDELDSTSTSGAGSASDPELVVVGDDSEAERRERRRGRERAGREITTGGGEENEDEYDLNDGFLVDDEGSEEDSGGSGTEASAASTSPAPRTRRHRERRRRRRASPSNDDEEEDEDDSEAEERRDKQARRRRRARRHEGEVVDLESDTESEESGSDSGSGSGSSSESGSDRESGSSDGADGDKKGGRSSKYFGGGGASRASTTFSSTSPRAAAESSSSTSDDRSRGRRSEAPSTGRRKKRVIADSDDDEENE